MFFSKKTIAAASLALLGGSASAQLSGLGLSSSCTGSAVGLLFNDFGNCLNLAGSNGLINVITASGSIVAPLDSYLGTICSSSACSNGTLTDANNTITQNCGTDIQDRNTLVTALQTIINEYPVVREVACLQATGNNSRCLTQTLYAVQNATGEQLSTSFLTGLLSGSGLSNLTNIDASVLCTDCTKAMYQTAQTAGGNNGTFAASALGRAIDSKCGSGFASTFPSGSVTLSPIPFSSSIPSSARTLGHASSSSSRVAVMTVDEVVTLDDPGSSDVHVETTVERTLTDSGSSPSSTSITISTSSLEPPPVVVVTATAYSSPPIPSSSPSVVIATVTASTAGTFPSGVTDPFSSSTAAATGASQTGAASASTSSGASVKDWTVSGNSVWIASLVGFVGVAGGAIGIFA